MSTKEDSTSDQSKKSKDGAREAHTHHHTVHNPACAGEDNGASDAGEVSQRYVYDHSIKCFRQFTEIGLKVNWVELRLLVVVPSMYIHPYSL